MSFGGGLLGAGVGHMETATVPGTRFPCSLHQLCQILEKQLARVRGTVPAYRTYHISVGLQRPCGSCGTASSYAQGQGQTEACFMLHWTAFWASS